MANNSKMKKNSLNRSKRKIIPMCYQKLNLSRSNTSLSQLISLGVYKKRINDLVKNNRLLAVALQEARLENTYQNNLLKEYAKCSNQMKIFKFKINEMVKTTITKLVSELNELVKCLDDDWSVDGYNFLQNKGPHDRMKIKGPTVECVEEEGSVLSSENDECETVSNEIQSEKTHDGRDMQEMEPVVSEPDANSAVIPDMPPILYIDDSEEQSNNKKSLKKSKSRSRSSSRRRVADNQLSLTPELDIDVDFMSQRQNSSRRQTQVFTPVRSLGRSRKASSVGQTFIEHETPKNNPIRRESIPQRKLSPVLLECDESSNNANKLEVMNINTKTRGSKNEDLSDLQISSVNTDDSSANINNPLNISLMVSPGKITVNNVANSDCTLANHTILISEDMELTDVVRPVAEIDIGSTPTHIVKAPFNISDNLLRVGNKAEKLNLVSEDECNDSKLLAYSEDTEVIPIEEYQGIGKKDNNDSISNVILPCKSNEPSENAVAIDESPSESPFQRRSSRKRKNIRTIEFSSTDSESDFTPMKPDKSKKLKIQRDTVIYKPLKKSSDVLASTENAKKDSLASEEVHKKSPNALSVYDLDVSNSKKPAKRSRPRNKAKSSLSKETAKPLSQKCNIIKLKGADCKFTKNENIDVKENQQPKISKPQETVPMILQNNAAKGNPTTFDLNEILVEDEKSIRASRDEVSSPKVADWKENPKEIGFKSPGARRVSFASTDVVCNFTRMSVPKTIVQNKKVHRISKSNFNTFDFNFGDLEMNETKRCSNNINLASDFETENTNLMEKPHDHATGKNYEDLELKLHKEVKVMLPKTNLHTLDEDFITTDPLALEESLNPQKVALPSEAPVISTTSTDENLDFTPHKEIAMLQEDPQPLVSSKKPESLGSKCQKLSKMSNKKSEKCVIVKTNDHQVLKSLEENPMIQKKIHSHNSNDKSESANPKFVKKNLNTRKSIPVHSSNITVRDADSKSPQKRLPLQKKIQMHSSATLAKNLDSKSVRKSLSSPKNVQSCGLGNVVESEDNTTTEPKVLAPSTSNIVKELDSGSLKESSDVQMKEKPLTLDNVDDLNSRSLKANASPEKKEVTHSSSRKVEDIASEPPKRNKQSRKKALQPISGKIHEDISTLSKCSNSSFQSANNNPHKMMTQNDFKENVLNHHVLDKTQTNPCVKTKKPQLKRLPPTDNFHNKVPDYENIKDLAQTVHKRGISSLELCQPSTCKKSSNLRLSVESSPVLKDVMNLEDDTNKRQSSRRARGAVVSYKEKKLNVKMRRE